MKRKEMVERSTITFTTEIILDYLNCKGERKSLDLLELPGDMVERLEKLHADIQKWKKCFAKG